MDWTIEENYNGLVLWLENCSEVELKQRTEVMLFVFVSKSNIENGGKANKTIFGSFPVDAVDE